MVFPVSIKLRVSAIAVMTSLLLSACTMVPEYQRPEASVPLAWSYKDTTAKGIHTPAVNEPFESPRV